MEDKKGKRGIISNPSTVLRTGIQHPISNYEVRRQKPGKGKSKKVHKSTRHKSSSQGKVRKCTRAQGIRAQESKK